MEPKPLTRRSKQQMRAQRVWKAENRIERQAAKWTAEGTGNEAFFDFSVFLNLNILESAFSIL